MLKWAKIKAKHGYRKCFLRIFIYFVFALVQWNDWTEYWELHFNEFKMHHIAKRVCRERESSIHFTTNTNPMYRLNVKDILRCGRIFFGQQHIFKVTFQTIYLYSSLYWKYWVFTLVLHIRWWWVCIGPSSTIYVLLYIRVFHVFVSKTRQDFSIVVAKQPHLFYWLFVSKSFQHITIE